MFAFKQKQQNNWLKAILCSASEAIFVTHKDWTISIANDAAQAVFGLKEDALIGLKLNKFLSSWLDTNSWENVKELSGNLEIDGAYFKYSLAHITENRQEGYVCILAEISALRRLDELKTQMIRMASHDLRSPITSLRLQYYMLKKQANTPGLNEHLDRMRISLDNLQEMVDNLLDIEWIERQAAGGRAAFSIASILESTISVLMGDAVFKQQSIESFIEPDLPFICGDPVRLQEVFRNLLANAIKYTPNQGLIQIRANLAQDHILISIQDNGIGIHEADIKRVFNPHFRANNALEIEGKGLGLSLVKSIIEEHGGKIWLESRLGQGTCFSFKLPIDTSCMIDLT